MSQPQKPTPSRAFDTNRLNEKLAANPALQNELRQNPQATIEKTMNLPSGALAGYDIQVVDVQPNTLVIPVPMTEERARVAEGDPASALGREGISEENLDAVAGGLPIRPKTGNKSPDRAHGYLRFSGRSRGLSDIGSTPSPSNRS